MSHLIKTVLVLLLSSTLVISNLVIAGDKGMFEVTVTNVTKGQYFTPILIASSQSDLQYFKKGQAASLVLEQLAEGGAVNPLSQVLTHSGQVLDTAVSSGLLAPGVSVTLRVRMNDDFDHIILAAMMIPSNDGFIALNGVHGPKEGKLKSFEIAALDAGTEPNDEICSNIPGPDCGGQGYNPDRDSAEGYVHTHAGIQGNGSLAPEDHDWRNPVAIITIKRIKK